MGTCTATRYTIQRSTVCTCITFIQQGFLNMCVLWYLYDLWTAFVPVSMLHLLWTPLPTAPGQCQIYFSCAKSIALKYGFWSILECWYHHMYSALALYVHWLKWASLALIIGETSSTPAGHSAFHTAQSTQFIGVMAAEHHLFNKLGLYWSVNCRRWHWTLIALLASVPASTQCLHIMYNGQARQANVQSQQSINCLGSLLQWEWFAENGEPHTHEFDQIWKTEKRFDWHSQQQIAVRHMWTKLMLCLTPHLTQLWLHMVSCMQACLFAVGYSGPSWHEQGCQPCMPGRSVTSVC